jgi:hypothetical protein
MKAVPLFTKIMKQSESLLKHLKTATLANPLSSKKLSELIRIDTGKPLDPRNIRKWISVWQHKNKLLIGATRTGEKKGYFMVTDLVSFNVYKREMTAHIKNETNTLRTMTDNFYKSLQPPLFGGI